MAYNESYNPCDDCPHSFSKNNQESSVCKICEFKELLDKVKNMTNVVYCKDCALCKKAVPENYCTLHSTRWLKFYVKDSSFCSKGERNLTNG